MLFKFGFEENLIKFFFFSLCFYKVWVRNDYSVYMIGDFVIFNNIGDSMYIFDLIVCIWFNKYMIDFDVLDRCFRF